MQFSILATATLGMAAVFSGGYAVADDDVPGPMSTETARPKIGLALAGGGARGSAHIGVIKVLEENRIPIDFIAGTSMGAIIGGLYAMGHTPDEMDKLLADIDWDDIFHDNIDRPHRSFHRKRDDDFSLVEFKPGFNDGKIDLPTGMIQGQKLDLLFSRLTLPVAHVKDFDNLSIPYRAVAANIVTGMPVVLGSGNLAQAMRASMSIPAVFAPIRIDGQLLVDGGVVNNIPIDVVREMGADIVIAIDISSPLQTEAELTSWVAITGQLTGFLTRRNAEAQMATLTDKDLLIVPELGDMSAADFGHAPEAVPIGVTEAEKHVARLRTWSLSADEYAAHLAARPRPADKLPIIDFVVVENDSVLGDKELRARTERIIRGQPLNVDLVEQDINTIYGTELFQNIRYEIIEDDGQTGLKVDLEKRSWGPNYLEFGITTSGDFQGGSSTGLNVSYLRTALNELNGESRLGVRLGENGGVFGEFYQPLNAGGQWFVVPLLGYTWGNIDNFAMGNITSEVRIRQWGGSLAVGRELGTWGEIRIGLRRTEGKAEVRVGPPMPDLDFDVGESFIRFSVDKLDSTVFPRHGYNLFSEYTFSRDSLGADTEFDQLLVTTASFNTWGRNTLGLIAKYGAIHNGVAPVQSIIRAGGLFNLSGYQFNELSGQYAALLAGIYYREIHKMTFSPVYAGISLEYGNVFQSSDEIKFDNGLFG
ncbi:MAG: patatin-like phospholipase family protein, partial [Gammaproteobacteria bacterium]|nr:patatin-like phospholipase family protein [Gammaproteobacteria bacterium]